MDLTVANFLIWMEFHEILMSPSRGTLYQKEYICELWGPTGVAELPPTLPNAKFHDFFAPLFENRTPVGNQSGTSREPVGNQSGTSRDPAKNQENRQKCRFLAILVGSRLVPDWFPTGSRLVPDWFPTGVRFWEIGVQFL